MSCAYLGMVNLFEVINKDNSGVSAVSVVLMLFFFIKLVQFSSLFWSTIFVLTLSMRLLAEFILYAKALITYNTKKSIQERYPDLFITDIWVRRWEIDLVCFFLD